jgi:hypothetical protein
MKTFEALVSLVVLLSIIAAITIQPQPVNTSLYKYQLANDVWRVMQLRGSTHDAAAMNSDAAALSELTGLCVKIDEDCDADQTTTERTAYLNSTTTQIRVRVGQQK